MNEIITIPSDYYGYYLPVYQDLDEKTTKSLVLRAFKRFINEMEENYTIVKVIDFSWLEKQDSTSRYFCDPRVIKSYGWKCRIQKLEITN